MLKYCQIGDFLIAEDIFYKPIATNSNNSKKRANLTGSTTPAQRRARRSQNLHVRNMDRISGGRISGYPAGQLAEYPAIRYPAKLLSVASLV